MSVRGQPQRGRMSLMWVLGVAGGLAVPFPGPHVERYVSLIVVAARAPDDASHAFWLLFGLLWAGGALAICGLGVIGARVFRRFRPKSGRPG